MWEDGPCLGGAGGSLSWPRIHQSHGPQGKTSIHPDVLGGLPTLLTCPWATLKLTAYAAYPQYTKIKVGDGTATMYWFTFPKTNILSLKIPPEKRSKSFGLRILQCLN